jgi:hypothetical protein
VTRPKILTEAHGLTTAPPKQVTVAARNAETALKNWRTSVDMHPRTGRPSKAKPFRPRAIVVGSTLLDLKQQLAELREVVGEVAIGNKRIGRVGLYADLLAHFPTLLQRGVTLPRGKSLSSDACSHGLGDILRKYRYTTCSDKKLMTDGKERERIGNSLSRVFERVARAVEKNTPAKTTKL